MITTPDPYVPVTLIALGAVALWLWLIYAVPAGRIREAIRGFGIAFILSCWLIMPARGQDAGSPIATYGSGGRVYVVIDPETSQRYLVFYDSYGIAVVPAPLPPPPAPVVIVPQGPPKPEGFWELSQTLAPLNAAQTQMGWQCTHTSMVNGHRIYHVRRKNPKYVEPTNVEK